MRFRVNSITIRNIIKYLILFKHLRYDYLRGKYGILVNKEKDESNKKSHEKQYWYAYIKNRTLRLFLYILFYHISFRSISAICVYLRPNNSTTFFISSAKGASRVMGALVRGWKKLSLAACKAWRLRIHLLSASSTPVRMSARNSSSRRP